MTTTQTPPPTTTVPVTPVVLWQTVEAMLQGYELITHLYPHFTPALYQQRLQQMVPTQYYPLAWLDDTGKCLGLAGLWHLTRLWCGPYVDIDNVIVHPEYRGKWIVNALIKACIKQGKAWDADWALLDAFVENSQAHKFYCREGFEIRGYHFAQALQGQALWGPGEGLSPRPTSQP